jgi:hypothetical protein
MNLHLPICSLIQLINPDEWSQLSRLAAQLLHRNHKNNFYFRDCPLTGNTWPGHFKIQYSMDTKIQTTKVKKSAYYVLSHYLNAVDELRFQNKTLE